MNTKHNFSRKIIRAISGIMALFMLLPLFPPAQAQNDWNMKYFYKSYPDSHFNLNNEPDRAMTIEEFIAIMHAYSYYGSGASSVTVVDKNGKHPSAWCGKYVQAEADKKVFDPDRISWNDPVTLAFAAQFMARSKGKYSYDANNIYSFSGTQNLSADDILYLCTAVDYGLIQYKSGMNVSTKILRRDARKYEIPKGLPSPKATMNGNANTMRELNTYYIDCYWDLDASAAQLNKLKQNSNRISMVTFQCGYINGSNISPGNSFLGCDIEHTEALTYSVDYNRDPQLDAIDFCKQTGKLALLGISNVSNNAFNANSVIELLSHTGNMQTAINEIVSAVNKYNLDGVNLGLEITNPSYSYLRSGYTTFVKLLATALHNQGKVLLVTIGAYFTDKQERESVYDYTATGTAADYVHVILYDDFNDTGFSSRGTYGPLSNIVRIGRCIRYASVKKDRSKILLGLGAFATDFNLTWWNATDISYEQAYSLLNTSGAQLVYDNTNNAAGAYFEYTDSSGCRHRVYLESGGTAAQRANVVKNYNLGGFSVYNLNDNNFPVYQAIDAISSFKGEITSAIQSGLVPVKLRSNYDKPILRREFCSVIVKFIESKTGMSAGAFLLSKGVAVNHDSFTDTYDNDVLIVNALGIVGGYGNRKFGPDKTISRQEAATMLMRLANVMGVTQPNSTTMTFKESPALQSWAQQGINFISGCVDLKSGKRIMGGTGNNMFSPFGTYTREQTFMSIYRLYNAF